MSDKQLDYKARRCGHRLRHPIIDSIGPFVVTPELAREREARRARHEWCEPQSKEECAISVFETDIPVRVGLLSKV